MLSATSLLPDALAVPATRVPVSIQTFTTYVVPPIACHVALALLAVTPQTRALRVALAPFVVLLALRATLSVDLSGGHPKQGFFNTDLAQAMTFIALNSLSWTLLEKPPIRTLRPAKSTPLVVLDALDLAVNHRGIGWDWSHGVHVTRSSRPTNRFGFAIRTFASAVINGLIAGSLHRAVQTFITHAGIQGPTVSIFDETLPLFLQYVRASVISTLGAIGIWTIMQLRYDVFTLVGVVFLGQDPAQWPPAFDSPWRATSLNEFWSRRWHQFFRKMFVLGAYPLTIVFGRMGTLVGAFLASGIYHYTTMLALDDQLEMWRMVVPFVMMIPGVLLERAFYRLTGNKVGGMLGWVWTYAWLVLWGNVLTDGFARVGMYTCSTSLDSQTPARALVDRAVTSFDAWLHALQ